YKVKFTAGTNGTIAATVDGEAITSGDEVEEGKTVVFTATPSTNFEVNNWNGKSKDSLVETGTNEVSIEVGGAVEVSVSFKASA
ncbi:MAG: leucine-rich repeat domain-containing protein, partial [Treponema sp.]|nr:leucine-rich repeat domain-containing protein [Treponema sp.]